MILSQTVNQDSKEKERLQCNIEDFAKPNQEMLMNRETEAEVSCGPCRVNCGPCSVN
jgi:hypothetical protein